MDIHGTKMLHKIQFMCFLRVIFALCLLKICQFQGSLPPGPHQEALTLDPTGGHRRPPDPCLSGFKRIVSPTHGHDMHAGWAMMHHTEHFRRYLNFRLVYFRIIKNETMRYNDIIIIKGICTVHHLPWGWCASQITCDDVCTKANNITKHTHKTHTCACAHTLHWDRHYYINMF